MPPRKPDLSEFELFRMLLTNMINMSHPLVFKVLVLAAQNNISDARMEYLSRDRLS